jgi:nicotinate-nucleotide adenylyltransferase
LSDGSAADASTQAPRPALADTRPRIGVLGGTFDPVHVGHLALARSARAALRLGQVRLLPTGQSWQKSGVVASATERLAMLRLAIGSEAGLLADDREVRRDGPSYTIDTLTELRAELGPDPALVLILGSDQLRNLATWRRWQALLDVAHIACTQREQVSLAELPGAVEALVRDRGRDALPDTPAGSVVFFSMPPVPVSATALRAALARGERPAELVAPAVLHYIETHRLYGVAPRGQD